MFSHKGTAGFFVASGWEKGDYNRGVKAWGIITPFLAAAPWVLSQVAPQPEPHKAEFSDVMAVFRAHCTPCHNGDVQRGGLRLDTKEGVIKGGNNGNLVRAGNPKASLLLQRIRGEGDLPRMPQGFAPINRQKEATIVAWIASGAKYGDVEASRPHWAYVSPKRPPLPQVANSTWAQNPIDRFVFAKLNERGMSPSAPAPLATLLRRISLDLTGLPPDPDEDDRYLLPEAGRVERFIESRLASPHFGERWASMWLDLARYADSNGYEKDLNRIIWPYRDWVINAFNRDMSFRQFTVEQLAGDLLPQPTVDQLVATGFHRNTLHNEEGGVDRGEQRWLTLVDRVGTTGTTWLGSSLACAQCHDHKYDPISQEDFYRFLAFFEPVQEVSLDLTPPEAKAILKHVAEIEAELKKAEGDQETQARLMPILVSLRAQAQSLTRFGSTLIFRPDPSGKAVTPIREKGAYLTPGNMVAANVPAVLGRLPEEDAHSRRQLADWIIDRRNPLTARVYVNRLWEHMFGVGLVTTSDEFGTQGSPPSHPELLDWLAVEFMESGWSTKHILRLIVSSRTYQQSSRQTDAHRKSDPENRWLARGPRFRLSAEAIRDSALAASGSLNRAIGGPSVFPYQPEGIWNLPYSGETWQNATDESGRRRALYTFIKRSAPYPSLLAFDATSRESCVPRRILTNSPMQALTLLNDPAFVEAARSLATRMTKSESPERNLMQGFRYVLFRRPDQGEHAALLRLWQRERDRMVASPAVAAELVKGKPDDAGVAERAAYVLVAQVMLNLDEAITKE